jgi:hypothetical protein
MKLFILLMVVESLSSVGLDSLDIFDEFSSTQAKIYIQLQKKKHFMMYMFICYTTVVKILIQNIFYTL